MSAPTQIAHYRITGKLGEGGMGAVYRAVDTKLNREVAIKVLPPALAHDADYIARFQREAQTLAALNHPNIATIFGIEGNAIVMELVEGSTLQGPMPLQEVLPIARQIAEALEAAHDKGIIHRDLKPGNIKLTPEGVVKVLDFGLAKAVNERPVTTGPDSPTLTLRATEAGIILGTAGYMSPEQAAGKNVDRRADIWSFGVVLYELLTGKRLFDGETVSHTLAHVLTGPIDLEGVPLRGLIERCLDRNLKTRLAHIGEARIAIERYAPEETKAPVAKASYAPWAVAAAAVAGLCAVSWLHFRATPAESLPSRSAILAPPDTTFRFDNGLGLPAISPDGRRLVFGAQRADGKTPLWVRPLDGLTAQPLAGTEGATFPFWSPDSRFIAFFADGKLKKIEAGGGPVVTITDAPSGRGGSWSPRGVIVFTPDTEGGRNVLHRVPAAGGKSALVAKGRFPFFLPDGVHFLHHSDDGDRQQGTVALCVSSVEGGACKEIFRAESNAAYAEGQLLFLRDGTLMAQPFDADSLTLTGEAVPVAERVQSTLASRFAGVFTVSTNGVLVYREGAWERSGASLVWVDREGKVQSTVGDPAIFVRGVALSPDRKTLAVSILDRANADIWTIDVTSGLRTRLTFDAALDDSPVWSPDGRTIAFASNRKGVSNLYRKPANGTGAEELFYADEYEKHPSGWSPDGKLVLFESQRDFRRTREGASGHSDIFALPVTAASPGQAIQPLPVVQTKEFLETDARFSPDGRWISYTQAAPDAESQVYVIAYPPGSGGKRQISSESGQSARWRPDGKELFYTGSRGLMWAAEVASNGPAFEVHQVRRLFSGEALMTFAVSGDGQRFLAPLRANQAAEPHLTLVQNWAAGLRAQ